MAGKIVLLLVMFAVISPFQVMAQCTLYQKMGILQYCDQYISKNARVIVAPKKQSYCCMYVRINKDMECIIRLLTNDEKMQVLRVRITNLAHLC
ncbi:hypothetical protein HU200_033307 [Digitaria exilis]|uniref:Bifunctional inhibitor/plant lipid transfer protein/seed storage helical domain-containing protein n=1 Tax=Digitaria exilis TaxID=1010633 RepID=A0A835EPU2_9POAL|nr:hypothetical protein HU200_036026 [Digitaria exilis]KAF8701973.1 hypothetical protein HU200_033307 [Digitaria exilis]